MATKPRNTTAACATFEFGHVEQAVLRYSRVRECRFKYTHNFLQWALQPPGYKPEWHIGVRVKGNNKLVGFITGSPLLAHTTTQFNIGLLARVCLQPCSTHGNSTGRCWGMSSYMHESLHA